MAVLGYIRVSTLAQATEGVSLPTQRRQVTGYCLLHGLHLSQVFIERDVSGSVSLAARPEGKRLLARLKSSDTVIIPRLDRAFRSAADAVGFLDRCKKDAINLVLIDLGGSVTHSPVSRLIFQILSAVAEFERELVLERAREIKADQKRRGLLTGRRPFGYRVQESGGLKHLVPDPLEQSAFPEIFALKERGLSLHAIANALRQRGINISHSSVRAILLGRIQPAQEKS